MISLLPKDLLFSTYLSSLKLVLKAFVAAQKVSVYVMRVHIIFYCRLESRAHSGLLRILDTAEDVSSIAFIART